MRIYMSIFFEQLLNQKYMYMYNVILFSIHIYFKMTKYNECKVISNFMYSYCILVKYSRSMMYMLL